MGNSFIFKTELWISKYTGIKVYTIRDFIEALKVIDKLSLFYHVYINMFKYHDLPVHYSNSFAYWLYKNNYILLAEKISAIDPVDYYDLEDLRRDLVHILETNYDEKIKRELTPFYFRKAERQILELGYQAKDLKEFIESFKNSSINSLFYHLITSKLEKKSLINDYSEWLISIGEAKKAEFINKLDIYSDNLYDIKKKILNILEDKK